MAQFITISDFANNINKGTFGIVMLTATTPKMRKTNNPYFGRVIKVSYRTNVALGWGYEKTIEGRLEKKGLPTDFEVEKPKGKTWVAYPFILEKDSDTSVQYLRTFTRNNTTSKSVFMLDGVLVTDNNIIAEIKSFIPTPSDSAKQIALGLTNAEDRVNPLDYTLENILYIAQSDNYYTTNIDNIKLVQMIREMK